MEGQIYTTYMVEGIVVIIDSNIIQYKGALNLVVLKNQ